MSSPLKPSSRSRISLIALLWALFISRYIFTVTIPGPMSNPLKYQLISGMLASSLDVIRAIQSIIVFDSYRALNHVVESYDRLKIRSYDTIQHEDQMIDDILIRTYTPKTQSNKTLSPVIVSIHGGGLFFGSIYSHDSVNQLLSLNTGLKVISINYRLTPYVKYPVPIEDCVKVVAHLSKHHEHFGIDPNQIFLFGDSAGAYLAVVVERQLRALLKSQIRGVVLVYPFLQLVHFRLPSYTMYLKHRLLSMLHEHTLAEMINYYLNSTFDAEELLDNRHLSMNDFDSFNRKLNRSAGQNELNTFTSTSFSHPSTEILFDINVSPLLADDSILLNSPSTLLVACKYDIFLSDVQLYYERLQNLRVNDIVYNEYSTFHGAISFVDFPFQFPEAFDILRDSAKFIVDRLIE